MKNMPILTVMLTHNDITVRNAYEIFEGCRNSSAEYWGFKEEPLPFDQMKELVGFMKQCGKKTVLEVVSYDEENSLKGAQTAVGCGVDYLMGTVYSDSVNRLCKENDIKYLPFVGKVSGRPSVLEGDIDEIIAQAKGYLEKGVYGIDLLGYRYTGDAKRLIERFVCGVNAPVCVAGSVDSYEKLEEISRVAPWSFTIGSAFFENRFGNSFSEQIDRVCGCIAEKKFAVEVK